jgi:drug/metabolite transporter (DMT)-like permease
MITIVFGFATALVYGFADFFGAVASKTLRSIVVTAVASLAGLILLLASSIWLGADYSIGAIQWGITAGLASAIAMSCLYAALAIGPISIVSPLTAVISAIVPAIVGVTQGDKFSWFGWLAIGLILVATVLVGFVPGEAVRLPSRLGLLLGLAAGTFIGIVLVCLDQTPADSGVAPIILLRTVGTIILGISSFIVVGRAKRQASSQNLSLEKKPVSVRVWAAVVLAGLFDSMANIFFILGSRSGALTVVSVLTALYPVGTILLARLVLKERIAATQSLGIGLAITGCMLLGIS